MTDKGREAIEGYNEMENARNILVDVSAKRPTNMELYEILRRITLYMEGSKAHCGGCFTKENPKGFIHLSDPYRFSIKCGDCGGKWG